VVASNVSDSNITTLATSGGSCETLSSEHEEHLFIIKIVIARAATPVAKSEKDVFDVAITVSV
jgi:hypothetical protein